jgi:integrase
MPRAAPHVEPMNISQFMDECRTKGSAYTYRAGIIAFLDFIYGEKQENHRFRKGMKCTDGEFKFYENLSVKYLKQKRNYGEDVKKFVQYMRRNEEVSTTISTNRAAIMKWLFKNRISLNDFDKQSIKDAMPRSVRKQTHHESFDVDQLGDVIQHLDIRVQSLVLCLASSGARIGELLNAKLSDLHDDKKPVSIYIRKTKTDVPRTVFISDEAYGSLQLWLKMREEWIRTAGERTNRKKICKKGEMDDRIFPYVRTSVYPQWRRALTKAGLYEKDSVTNRNVLSVHRLRAFNRDRVASVVGGDTAEILLGHVDNYGNTYKDTSEKTLSEKYQKCQDSLTIKNSGRVKQELKAQSDELERLRKTNQELSEKLTKATTSQTDEMGSLKAQILAMQNTMARMIARMKEDDDLIVKEHEEWGAGLSDDKKAELEKMPRPHLTVRK